MAKRIVFMIITALLTLALVTPAIAEDEVTLEIRNLSQSQVSLVISGPTDLKLTIKRVLTKVRVQPGTYEYRYRACGLNRTGTFAVGSNGGSLLLKKCERDLNGSITIQNLTGKQFNLRMSGPRNYSLLIKPGDNKLTIVAGRYGYSANVCLGIEKGEHGIKSGRKNVDWVFEVCD